MTFMVTMLLFRAHTQEMASLDMTRAADMTSVWNFDIMSDKLSISGIYSRHSKR